MKKSILHIMFFLVCNLLAGQELAIKGFYLADKDISGSVYPREDANGEFCSLIKVQTNIQGEKLTFQGNTVGKTIEKDGDFWVYVIPGTKFLKIRCKSYLPVDVNFADYGIKNTKSKMTYILNIVSMSLFERSTDMQQFRIKFSPSYATIKINNRKINVSDGLFDMIYPTGSYTYEISCPGYKTVSKTITLTSSSPFSEDISLVSENGKLSPFMADVQAREQVKRLGTWLNVQQEGGDVKPLEEAEKEWDTEDGMDYLQRRTARLKELIKEDSYKKFKIYICDDKKAGDKDKILMDEDDFIIELNGIRKKYKSLSKKEKLESCKMTIEDEDAKVLEVIIEEKTDTTYSVKIISDKKMIHEMEVSKDYEKKPAPSFGLG